MGYVLLGMMLLLGMPANAQDNEVLIDPAGDNVILEGNQEGYDNIIDIDLGITSPIHVIIFLEHCKMVTIMKLNLALTGNSNELAILQEGNNNT